MLPYVKQCEKPVLKAQESPGLLEVGLRIITRQVAAIGHHVDGAFVAIAVKDVLNGLLRDPNRIRLLVEADDLLDDDVEHGLSGDDPREILAVFGVEGGHQGNLLQAGNPCGSLARDEGAVRVDYLETPLQQSLEEGRIYLGDARHIGRPEWYRYGEIVEHFVVPVAVIHAGIAGRYDCYSPYPLLHPAGIILYADGNTVHHGRKTLVEKAYVGFFHLKKNYSTYRRRPLRYSPSGW